MTRFLREVFTFADAQASGLSKNQLRGARYHQVCRGVYTTGNPDAIEIRAQAALLAGGPKALLAGLTVLRFLGVWLPQVYAEDKHIHINMPPGASGPTHEFIIVTRSTVVLEPVELWDILGLMGVHPAQAWLQAANYLDHDDLIVAADALMRRQYPISTRPEIDHAVGCISGSRGVSKARRALKLARAGVDSPMETRLRLALVAHGLPCPEVNLPLRPQPDGPLYYLDMAYPAIKLAVEYDGAGHAATRQQMQRDQFRRRVIEDAGWRIITATAADSRDWSGVVASVCAGLNARLR